MTDEKPATDEEITALREECAKPGTWAIGSATAASLIARIDAERAARLAAEARVKVLREALRKAADAFDSYVVIHQDKKTPDGDRKAQLNRDLSAMCVNALKEHAND